MATELCTFVYVLVKRHGFCSDSLARNVIGAINVLIHVLQFELEVALVNTLLLVLTLVSEAYLKYNTHIGSQEFALGEAHPFRPRVGQGSARSFARGTM